MMVKTVLCPHMEDMCWQYQEPLLYINESTHSDPYSSLPKSNNQIQTLKGNTAFFFIFLFWLCVTSFLHFFTLLIRFRSTPFLCFVVKLQSGYKNLYFAHQSWILISQNDIFYTYQLIWSDPKFLRYLIHLSVFKCVWICILTVRFVCMLLVDLFMMQELDFK